MALSNAMDGSQDDVSYELSPDAEHSEINDEAGDDWL